LALDYRAAQPARAATGGESPGPPREKAIAVDVRSAALADVLTRASEATGVKMTAGGAAGDQRVTLHAGRTTAGELRQALQDLLRLKSRPSGTDTSPEYSLTADHAFAGQVEAWRLRQTNAFMDSLLRTASGFEGGREAKTLEATRDRFRRDHPEFTETMLAPLTADYLRQSALVTALPPAARTQLARSGSISLPVAWLWPAAPSLLLAFAQSGAGWFALDQDAVGTGAPVSRVQYQLLYGDRWTDRMLVVQIGAPGEWSTAVLPFILFRQQDDSALYPAAAERPDDPDVWRRLPPHFDTRRDWDSVLVELAKRMGIKLAADSYARPWLFHADQPLPDISGIPLREALDRLCRQHGYFWWKQDGWYCLRSRAWTEENRVAVPDRLPRGWVESIRARGALSGSELFQLAGLSEEQLLTLDLESSPPGSDQFMSSGFNPNEAALMANGLLLFHLLPAQEQELALTAGVPALWMPAAPQNLFAAAAAQVGAPLLPEMAESWGFRVRQGFGSVVEAGDHPVSGEVSVEWQWGPGDLARAAVSISDRALHRMEDTANPSNAR
jgi:hypothetical protein